MMKKWLRNSDIESDDRKRDDEKVIKRKLRTDNKREAAFPERWSPGLSQDAALNDDERIPFTRSTLYSFPNRQTIL